MDAKDLGRGVLDRITGPYPKQEGIWGSGAVRHGPGLTRWDLSLESLQKQPEEFRIYVRGSRESWNVLEQRRIVMELVFKEDKLSSVV